MKVGDLIKVKGKTPDWLDKQRGIKYADWLGIVINVYPSGYLFDYQVMKSDGTTWNCYKKHIARVFS